MLERKAQLSVIEIHDARFSIRGIIKRNSENLKSVIEKPRHAVLRSASLSIGAGSMWLSPRAKFGNSWWK
jgi:hypothetical protein